MTTVSESKHRASFDVEVRYENLCMTVVKRRSTDSLDVAGAFKKLITLPWTIAKGVGKAVSAKVTGKATPEDLLYLQAMRNVSGVIRPGTLTLVLGPPGSGKSCLLKAIAQRLPKADKRGFNGVTGKFEYCGSPVSDADKAGVHLGRLVQYVSQLDEHLPFLTVRETLEFLANNALSMPEPGKNAPNPVDETIGLLHLRNCASTLIGNDLVRGVSGGEKKRVTVAEGLLTPARVLCLDEISTGLDSAVTYDIVNSLRKRCDRTRMSAAIALLQPTPEVFSLFDEVVLLIEGHVVYHGPRDAIAPYFESLGFRPPRDQTVPDAAPDAADASGSGDAPITRQQSAPTGPSEDLADWMLELLTNPTRTYARGVSAERAREEGNALQSAMSAFSLAAMAEEQARREADAGLHTPGSPSAKTPPLTAAGLAAAWQASDLFAQQMGRPCSVPSLVTQLAHVPAGVKATFTARYPHSAMRHFGLMLQRQFRLMGKNRLYLFSRIMTSCIMSVVLGALYFRLPADQALTYYGTFLNALMTNSFSNASEMATAVEYKFVGYKHVDSGAHPGWTFPLAAIVAHLPVAVVETLIFCVIVYFMSGMAGQFFLFWFFTVAIDVLMAALFRAFAYASRTLEEAQNKPMPLIALMILFAGFLVTKPKMGWLVFMLYIDFFGWALRSMAINEFFDARYSTPTSTGLTQGQTLLDTFGLPYGEEANAWKWGGFIFIWGFLVLVCLYSVYAFVSVRYDRNIGSSRDFSPVNVAAASGKAIAASTPATPMRDTADASVVVDAAVEDPSSPKAAEDVTTVTVSASSVLPFEPLSLAFVDINYTVNLPSHMGGGTRQLLHSVTGMCQPGRMIALMGASGAGKTTLLDVLAARKNSGTMAGRILVNGVPKNSTHARLMAYVEQTDVHQALPTVREAIEFAALLRLPASVNPAQRAAFVDEILDVLELRDIADRQIGDAGAQGSLAPGERKRLTIGVELAGNSPIIFADEPTSGLSSAAAAMVMRVLRRVASRGRTIICTIHQPSQEVFLQFDDLLLLQRGGWQVYMGPVGRKGRELRHHLEGYPGTSPCPAGMNPASWMLDVLGGTDSSGKPVASARSDAAAAAPVIIEGTQLFDFFKASAAHKRMQLLLDVMYEKAAAQVGGGSVNAVAAEGVLVERASARYARGFFAQFGAVFRRDVVCYSRNVPAVFGRCVATSFLSLLFGVIWFDISPKSTDLAGIQSLVAAIFMSAAFMGFLNMNVVIPLVMNKRAAFYRETSSAMYMPIVYALSGFLIEVPVVILVTLTALPITYFMFGLVSSAAAFFTHAAVTAVMGLVFVTIGSALASLMPNFQVAQVLGGLLLPLFFLFGGMWAPPSQMVPGARWFCWIDPITYAFKALIPPQFYGENINVMIPVLDVASNTYVYKAVNRYDYVSAKYEVWQDDRFANLGYLSIFIAVFLLLTIMGTQFVRHLTR